jgi:aconitate hydratase
MVNGLAVLGWGVGGIEAEAAMLGQPIPMLIPEVIGFRLTGAMPEGATATDLVLTVTQMLRKKGVVGKFVEFYGPGLAGLTIEDQATIANMAPEYGATCGFFPVTKATIDYLRPPAATPSASPWWKPMPRPRACGSSPATSRCSPTAWNWTWVRSCRRWPAPSVPRTGPALRRRRRVQVGAGQGVRQGRSGKTRPRVPVAGEKFDVGNGDVVIAAITSCTNTSNPSVLIAAGLVAKKRRRKGPEGEALGEDLAGPRLAGGHRLSEERRPDQDLDALGFNLVGYGCTTCIGNSGPLPEAISERSTKGDLVACSVLSGNRNFEGRVNPDVRANYLASPPLVVAYALAGSMNIDLATEPLGQDKNGKPVFLKDIWPTSEEIADLQRKHVTPRCSPSAIRTSSRATSTGRHQGRRRPDLRLGHRLDLRAEPALLRGHEDGADAGDRHRRGAASSVSSATRSPPTTSRPAGSIKAASPAGVYLRRTPGPTDGLQPATAPAAATTKS